MHHDGIKRARLSASGFLTIKCAPYSANIQTLKNPRQNALQPEQATRLLMSSGSVTHL
jgi:hypothetical protein